MLPTGTQKVDVFAFLDYREFLKSFAAEAKRRSAFSVRNFSRRIGVRSPSHLTRVISGERSLTPAMARLYTSALGLSDEQADYFRTLVLFNDANTTAEREEAYTALRRFRGYRKAQKLDDQRAEFFTHWFMPAVLELANRDDFEADPAWVANQLRPKIDRKEAKLALQTLKNLELLRETEGRWRPADKVISTGAQTASVHVAQYHRNMIRRAEAAMELFSATERDISALTLCVPRDALANIKARLAELRQELLTLYENQPAEQVVHVNIQLFPMSGTKP